MYMCIYIYICIVCTYIYTSLCLSLSLSLHMYIYPLWPPFYQDSERGSGWAGTLDAVRRHTGQHKRCLARKTPLPGPYCLWRPIAWSIKTDLS